MSEIELHEAALPAQPVQTMAAQSGTIEALMTQAQAMEAASRIAQGLCGTQMVPKSYFNKPAEGAAAIMYGMEIGLNPIQSLQSIMVINGKPGIEARTMVALLKRQGYCFETVESSPERVTVRGTSPRGEVEESTWTKERANQAGYAKNALYAKIPEQMLYAKAASEVSRRLAPDVLMGISYSQEELKLGFGDDPEPSFTPSERVAPQSRPQSQQRALPASSPQKSQVTQALFGSAPQQRPPEPVPVTEIRKAQSIPELQRLGENISEWLQQNPGDRDAVALAWREKENELQQN